ncbi:MAG: hypothetical protein O2856_10425, partial [Planctomycetota bacterium]|nr:hypothetical protein [Planctomycetota bacterium]
IKAAPSRRLRSMQRHMPEPQTEVATRRPTTNQPQKVHPLHQPKGDHVVHAAVDVVEGLDQKATASDRR